MNASRTTLATDFSDSYPSSNSHHSQDADNRRQGPATNKSTPPRARLQSPSPHQLRQDSLPPSEPAKASSVNDRIRDWARKSFPLTRKGPEQPDEMESPRRARRQSKAPSPGQVSVLSQAASSTTTPSLD